MYRQKFLIALIAVVSMLSLSGCGSKEASPLVAESETISEYLKKASAENPGLISKASAEYADAVMTLSISFADSCVRLAPVELPAVEYFTAIQLKANGGESLNTLVNALIKEKGKLVLDFTDVYGTTKKFDIDGKRLATLVKEPLSSLNFNAAKDNLKAIFASRCEAYRTASKAESVEFSIVNSFACYTFTFADSKMFSDWNQSNIDRRYQPSLTEAYDSFGMYRESVLEMMKSLGIDGYKFVYTTTDGSKTLSSALPWRMI